MLSAGEESSAGAGRVVVSPGGDELDEVGVERDVAVVAEFAEGDA